VGARGRRGAPPRRREGVARALRTTQKLVLFFDGRTLRQNSPRQLLPRPSFPAATPRARAGAALLRYACDWPPTAACVGQRQGNGLRSKSLSKTGGFWEMKNFTKKSRLRSWKTKGLLAWTSGLISRNDACLYLGSVLTWGRGAYYPFRAPYNRI